MEEQRKTPQLRGLYGKVKISVKTLDKIIIGGVTVMLLVLFLGLQNRGYTVRFDSLGGTPVESQKHMYGELLDSFEAPTREGFQFDGWYQDEALRHPWDLDTMEVLTSLTLYAGWKTK